MFINLLLASNRVDNYYLQELIEQTKERGGGLILNYDGRPAVVVLSVEKYNQLISESANQLISHPANEPDISFANQPISGPVSQLSQKILLTGGAGFIGAHAAYELIKEGHQVTILDNLSAGRRENISPRAKFIEGDLADINLLKDLFAGQKFDCVMHFAASVEVEESIFEPQKYFQNNALNTANLLEAMREGGVSKLIFSSTAAVYGEQERQPISETAPLRPNNPYGYSKLLAEKVIKFYCQYLGMRAIVFRYFNACGGDFEGKILPTHESHLIPKVLEVARGEKLFLTINGNDYGTPDGTCVRDFVHVLDIARAHVMALNYFSPPASLFPSPSAGDENFRVYNIGASRGTSVLEVVNKAAEVLNKIIPMEMGPRRAGDAAVTIADNSKIKSEMGFELRHSDLETIIQTSWGRGK